MSDATSRLLLRWAASLVAARRLDLQVEGLHYLPSSGPVLLVCRHYHHLYDGCALLAVIPRSLGLVVGLDWLRRPASRRLMELACRAAGWPVVLRGERLQLAPSAYRPGEVRRYVRSALRSARAELASGGALVIFPEGYPVIDPNVTPRPAHQTLLPFRPGFLHMIEAKDENGEATAPIIPIGLAYAPGKRWRVVVRLGPPIYHQLRSQRTADLARVEATVRQLSGLVQVHAGT